MFDYNNIAVTSDLGAAVMSSLREQEQNPTFTPVDIDELERVLRYPLTKRTFRVYLLHTVTKTL